VVLFGLVLITLFTLLVEVIIDRICRKVEVPANSGTQM